MPVSVPARARAVLCVLLAVLLSACGPRAGGPPGASPSATRSFGPVPSGAPSATPSAGPSASPPVGGAGPLRRFAAVGDVGDGSAAEARVAGAIARTHAAEHLDLLLLLGDLIYPDGDPGEYQKKFADPYEPVLSAGIPMLATLGNHDILTDPEAVQRAFGMPSPYFTVVRGPVEFFVIDTSRASVDRAQTAWFERALKASVSPWKVAVTHVPLYSSGALHGSNRRLQADLQGLFERYRVQLVLAGHDHNYERTVEMQGVTYVVSGGGCCPRNVGRSAFTAATATGLHFVVVDVRPDVMRLTARTPSGEIFDTAVIPR